MRGEPPSRCGQLHAPSRASQVVSTHLPTPPQPTRPTHPAPTARPTSCWPTASPLTRASPPSSSGPSGRSGSCWRRWWVRGRARACGRAHTAALTACRLLAALPRVVVCTHAAATSQLAWLAAPAADFTPLPGPPKPQDLLHLPGASLPLPRGRVMEGGGSVAQPAGGRHNWKGDKGAGDPHAGTAIPFSPTATH